MRVKHQPCACGCGELADECTTGRNPLSAFEVVAPVGGLNTAQKALMSLGDEAFRQNWRKRVERAEAKVSRVEALAEELGKHTAPWFIVDFARDLRDALDGTYDLTAPTAEPIGSATQAPCFYCRRGMHDSCISGEVPCQCCAW